MNVWECVKVKNIDTYYNFQTRILLCSCMEQMIRSRLVARSLFESGNFTYKFSHFGEFLNDLLINVCLKTVFVLKLILLISDLKSYSENVSMIRVLIKLMFCKFTNRIISKSKQSRFIKKSTVVFLYSSLLKFLLRQTPSQLVSCRVKNFYLYKKITTKPFNAVYFADLFCISHYRTHFKIYSVCKIY